MFLGDVCGCMGVSIHTNWAATVLNDLLIDNFFFNKTVYHHKWFVVEHFTSKAKSNLRKETQKRPKRDLWLLRKRQKKVFLIIAFALLHFFSVEVNIISLCFQSCIQKKDML